MALPPGRSRGGIFIGLRCLGIVVTSFFWVGKMWKKFFFCFSRFGIALLYFFYSLIFFTLFVFTYYLFFESVILLVIIILQHKILQRHRYEKVFIYHGQLNIELIPKKNNCL